ncbi:MAG TPA: hypothetical protein VK981_14915 [Ramlibacter sp.]|nr:hypothetical protein [Ramlibacter sp.]
MKTGAALLLLVLQAMCGPASAQSAAQTLAAACPKAHEMSQRHLLGLWRAEFEGMAQGATLLLDKHPEFPDSVRGQVNRNGELAEVSGDVDDGDFTLEESVNGTNISATWLGDVVEGSCGREIRGTWQSEAGKRPYPFVLRKL